MKFLRGSHLARSGSCLLGHCHNCQAAINNNQGRTYFKDGILCTACGGSTDWKPVNQKRKRSRKRIKLRPIDGNEE